MTAWLRAAGVVVLSRQLRAVLSIGMVIGISVVGTLALWSTTVNTQSGVFTTATINILADGSKNASFTFAPTAILPGQSAAKVVTVTNTGTAAYSYGVSVQSNTALGQAMTLTAVAGATASNGTCGAGTSLVSARPITATATTFASNRGPVAATTGTDTVCLQVTLPITAAATLADAPAASIVFAFTATAGT